MDQLLIPDFFARSAWYYQVVIIICCTTAISYILGIALSKLHRTFVSSNYSIKTILLTSIKPPLHFYIISLGLSEIIHIITKQLHIENYKMFIEVKLELLVISLFWFSLRIINKFEQYILFIVKKNPNFKLDHTTIGALAITARISFFMIAALVIMDLIGISISGLLTFGGISGIIVGFASKDLLTNFFGALTIYLDKPFKVGDWIKLQEKNIEGTVEKIGLRCTLIKTLEKRPLYVPNSYFSQVPVEVPSRMSHRQINEIIGIRHEDFTLVNKILIDIRTMLDKVESIDKNQNFGANFTGFSGCSANILVFAFSKSVNYKDFLFLREKILMNCTKIIFKHKANIAKIGDK